jgi:hypothetical protein
MQLTLRPPALVQGGQRGKEKRQTAAEGLLRAGCPGYPWISMYFYPWISLDIMDIVVIPAYSLIDCLRVVYGIEMV